MNALLPPDRKLLSMSQRGADWKALKKNDEVDITTKSRVYAYWHVETVLKDQYFGSYSGTHRKIQTNFHAFLCLQNFCVTSKMLFKELKLSTRSRRSFVPQSFCPMLQKRNKCFYRC